MLITIKSRCTFSQKVLMFIEIHYGKIFRREKQGNDVKNKTVIGSHLFQNRKRFQILSEIIDPS